VSASFKIHRAKSTLRLALVAVIAALLFAGLYPFNFFAKNQSGWLAGGDGIEFRGYGEVYGSSGIDVSGSSGSVMPLSLEFVVASGEGKRPSIETLFTIYQGSDDSFAIERWTEDLVVAGWFRNPQGQITFQRLFCGQVFGTPARRFITVISTADGTSVYVEGKQQRHYVGLSLTARNIHGTLLVGQASSAHQTWRGIIAGLALYPKPFSSDEVRERFSLWGQGNIEQLQESAPASLLYTFRERSGRVIHDQGTLGSDLIIPQRLHALGPVVLKFPNRRDLTDWADIVVNVAGFVPLGALIITYIWIIRSSVTTKHILLAVLAGLSISLAIELLQVFLPSRDSSLLDVIMNTLGTGIGGSVAMIGCSRLGGKHFIPSGKLDPHRLVAGGAVSRPVEPGKG
jgi:hypothetical protein